MTCDEANILLHALIDGELDAGHAREVEAHIATCPSCAAELAAYRQNRKSTTLRAYDAALNDFSRFAGVAGLRDYVLRDPSQFAGALAERLLTYALGRGIEYHDVESVDTIVDRIDKQGGRFSALLMGLIESAPFQKRRESPSAIAAKSPEPARTSTPQGSNP